MSKKVGRILSLVLVIMMVASLALAAAGCGQKQQTDTSSGNTSSSGSTSSEKSDKPSSAEPELKPVEITFSEQDDPNSVDPTWDELIKEFMDKYPAVTVKRQHLETEGQRTDWMNGVLAGAGPELISCPHDNIGVFATAQTAMELDNFVSKEFLAQFSEKDINDYKYEGKIYAIPYKLGNALTLVYNKKLLPEPPKTMDELIAKAKELTRGTEQYGLVFDMVEPFFILPYLGGYDGKVFDANDKLSLNTDAMKKMVQLVYDFKFTHKITPKEGNTDVANGLFNEGKAAMIINGPWFYKQAKDAGIDFGIANIPELSGGTWPAPYTGAKVLMVNPNITDENTKLAVRKFIEFVNTREAQLKLALVSSEIPTNLEAQKDKSITDNLELKALTDQMKHGTPMPAIPEMRCVWDSMRIVMAEVLGGTTKPEDAPAKMQKLAEEQAKTLQ